MSAEPLFHKLLEENSIPTSKIIIYSTQGEVIDREYIISEYIKSIPMNDPSLNGIELDYVYQEIGILTKRLHNIANNKFGWKRLDDWGLFNKWSEFILAFALEAAEKAEEYKILDQKYINKFKEIFDESIDLLDEITTPNMTHTDLWQGNILLKKDNDSYSVAAIIDLDRTIFGDKYWDLSTPWMINDSFIKGYGDEVKKQYQFVKRSYLYKLLSGFVATYVCKIEYDDIQWYENEKNNVISLLGQL